MTVFEDLIEELRDENLLETTVIATDQRAAAEPLDLSCVVDEPFDVPQIEKPSNEREFFRKRAMDEVSSLQMVEHVLSGVEREHMKTMPVSYDDLEAKKALHKFLQVSGDLKSPAHAEAEFALRHETEVWSFALFERDQKISAANIRRFCEESRPVLSSAALISLARFYRNAPFSEDVRGKFDLVMTRLFSREAGDDTRHLLFPRQEMIGHVTTLYANWSSIALYSRDEDAVAVSLAVTRFDEFGVDIESAETLEEVLESGLLNKIRDYKYESAEIFYVPEVVAAAINCNIKIGNRYVDLIDREKRSSNPAGIEEKYGFSHDQTVSNAAGKTLLLVDLLKRSASEEFVSRGPAPKAFEERTVSPAVSKKSDTSFDIFGINKWLMIIAIVCIAASVGVYLWADNNTSEDNSTTAAAAFSVDDADANRYLKGFRSTDETLYAIAQPNFETLGQDEQKAILQRLLKIGSSRSLKYVNIINPKGRNIAFASADRVDTASLR